ncbi:GntR family transcriptional regulator [Dasania sp. GY-MA-18]|uniref:GntR family transcriptional regulator n=1 Tax=Dasania phycosphaerae TaxID=2950436 RepID=A0A9J6RLN5_9GAMM|nr:MULTISPECIES: GntR family transcriptional regulator [Dasania]MCR8922859.1 GntR family transcriptional regulator [Dasania sp. GY-MA-18]MCZ0865290.1 GntR family transcriptional regulator [Dasania phycosphaerae]MCZ0869015.1 GntR family transcriptional regulator [Dasania phycosphaerae]
MNTDDKPSSNEPKTQQERVYMQLREAILRGKFEPGHSVTLRGIAEMLGVSLMPVRESLRRLTTERALQLLNNRRITVPMMTPEKLEELYQARVSLESYAASRAIQNIDPEALSYLYEVNEKHTQSILEDNVEDYIYLNFEFHRELYRYGRCEVVMPLIESLWLQIAPFMRMVHSQYLTESRFNEAEDKHKAMLTAIEKNNPAQLKYLIHDDILDGVRRLQAAMGWPISS